MANGYQLPRQGRHRKKKVEHHVTVRAKLQKYWNNAKRVTNIGGQRVSDAGTWGGQETWRGEDCVSLQFRTGGRMPGPTVLRPTGLHKVCVCVC